MEIKNKFDIGDEVYAISRDSEYYEFTSQEGCPICNDTGKVEINGYEFRCPHCMKHGNLWDYCCIPLEVCEIYIEVLDYKTEISYELNYNDYDYPNETFSEEDCFLTLEEAKVECKKRNKKLLTKVITKSQAKEFYHNLCKKVYGNANKNCQGTMSIRLIADHMGIDIAKANQLCNAMLKHGITERSNGNIIV